MAFYLITDDQQPDLQFPVIAREGLILRTVKDLEEVSARGEKLQTIQKIGSRYPWYIGRLKGGETVIKKTSRYWLTLVNTFLNLMIAEELFNQKDAKLVMAWVY